jgi:hypothetical protein
MKQKGFANVLLVLGFIVAIVVGFVFWRIPKNTPQEQTLVVQNPTSTPASTQGKNNTCPAFSQMVEAPHKTAVGAFTHTITEIDKIAVISPGKLTGDSRFTYLWINGNQRVPIYAPADGTLIKIRYKNRADLPPTMSMPDYDLLFLVDCKTIYRLNHISDPKEEIASLKQNSEPYQLGTGINPPSDEQEAPKENIQVHAGDLLGTTTGTPAAHNFDFGIFVDNQAVCPYEKFGEPLRTQWLALFGNAKVSPKPDNITKCEVSGKL